MLFGKYRPYLPHEAFQPSCKQALGYFGGFLQ